MGLTDQQSLAAYIKDSLSGTIPAAQYPERGEGRITTAMVDDMDDMDDMSGEELPATGVESRTLFLTGVAMITTGLLLASASHLLTTARRRKRLTI